MEIKSQNYVDHIRQFKCPNCGSELTLINKKTKYVGCNNCGTVSDPNSEASKIIMKLSSPTRHKPFSFFKIGAEAEIEGYSYKIIGRTRWRTTHHEYWSEGAYNGYGTEHWLYDEWLLMGSRFDYFYIVEDSEGFYLSKNFIPKEPIKPTSAVLNKGIDEKPISNQRLDEIGSAEVVYFEGESTYQIKPGDTINYASYKKKGVDYVIEWRLDDQSNETKEIEFFQETKVTVRWLEKIFKKNPEVQEGIFYQYKRFEIVSKILGWSAIVSLILAFFNVNPNLVNESFVIKPEKLSETADTITYNKKTLFDSVMVRTNKGKMIPLKTELLDQSVSYSKLLNPSYSFKTESIDTVIKVSKIAKRADYQYSIPSFKIKMKSGKPYYFDFDNFYSKLYLVSSNEIVDSIKERGVYSWEKDFDGTVHFLLSAPLTGDFDGYLKITERRISSLAFILTALILGFLWVLYLPIAELIYKNSPKTSTK